MFSFHASLDGCFRECWQLITNPALEGGVRLVVELAGVATMPDPLHNTITHTQVIPMKAVLN